MRLSDKEIQAIKSTLLTLFPRECYEVRLYGSRVNDSLRGGDIDLLILTVDKEVRMLLKESRLDILVQLYERIGEQKIDLSFAAQEDLLTDAFVKKIYTSSISLFKNGTCP